MYLEFSLIMRARLIMHFNYLFRIFVLYLLVRLFVLYLIHGCMITKTLLWYLYASWFQGPNIHQIFLLISLSFISLISFFIVMTPMVRYKNFLKIPPCVGLATKYPIMTFVGHHYKFNSFLLIRSVMKNK